MFERFKNALYSEEIDLSSLHGQIYRVSIKSFLITNIFYKKNTRNRNMLFLNVTQLKKLFYHTSVHFNV